MDKAVIKVKRIFKGANYTIGNLYINDVYICDTLEDTVRDLKSDGSGKIMHKTAIPKGEYKVTLEWSPKFGKILPFLHNVPFFTGILIHSGNTAEDSSGCILVGWNESKGQVLNSKIALSAIMKNLNSAKEITITIEE